MKWIARVFIFLAALVIGTLAASLFWGGGLRDGVGLDAPAPAGVEVKTLRAENLLGNWNGTWGHNHGDCTIVIDRVEDNAFYGTLHKQGAVVRFEGTFDPTTRMFRFDETEVVRLGANMTEWSLGKNRGLISQDGRILVGDGHDKWGQYGWGASNF